MRTISIIFFSFILFFSEAISQNNRPDSTSFFDPDGYYYPSISIRYGSKIIECFEITSIEYYYDGGLHYDKPHFLTPSVYLVVKSKNGGMLDRIKCDNVILSRDTLSFRITKQDIGAFSFDGIFLDKRGQYSNQDDIDPNKTIIMSGRVRILKEGNIIIDKTVRFTFWGGD